MTRGRLAIVAGAAMILLAGCTTVTKGTAFGPGQAPGPDGPANLSELSARLTHSATKVKSAQGTLNVDAGALVQSSTFRELLSSGQVTAFDDQVNTTYQGQETKLHLLYVDKKIYVDRGQNGKPWVVATPDSSDPIAAQLAESLPQTLSQSGIKYYVLMLSAGHDLKVVGTESVSGVQAVHYQLIVDPKELVKLLPSDQAQQMQQAVDAGVTEVPVDLWVDPQSRPVKVTDSVTAQGQTAHVEFLITNYDAAISIDAPPADQIDQG